MKAFGGSYESITINPNLIRANTLLHRPTRLERDVFNKDGDRPHGYDYPLPSIKGGSIGAKSSGRFRQLTDDDLERVRKAVVDTRSTSHKTSVIKKKS